jgi:carbamoyltransferase
VVILGLIDSKPAAAAVMIGEKIVSAIAEERLCRMKLATGMPRQAIVEVMSEAGITAKDIDSVAIAQHVSVYEPEPRPWFGWFNGEEQVKTYQFDRLSTALAPVVGHVPLAWKVHHRLKRFVSRDRVQKIPELLRSAYGITGPVRFYDHHFCHATTAYYTSNFDRALVVTLDGGGDGRSGSMYVGENGLLREIASIDSFNSLGNFYSYITHLCGFQAENHEGKVTGLAALGEPAYADILRQCIRYEEPGQVRYTVPMYHRSALRLLAERLPDNFKRADLAASAQLILEEIGTKLVRYGLRLTGLRKIAVAGGVFANVKLNQRIHELDEVDSFFVHPAMDDSGLSVGSALAALAEQPEAKPARLMQRLTNVYWGRAYTDREIERAIRDAGIQAQPSSTIHQRIAELLAQGYIVARFTGRMEYGPRALGHRSILYRTNDPSVNNWLNERLKRTEFMPFAPATLAEYTSDCYDGIQGAEDPARFMTITFACSAEMKARSPGVVHVDGTARPQFVDSAGAPDLYKILAAYHRLTEIPSLINTSFNMHGEPIVCTPEDALRSFRCGNLDYLAIGDWLVANPSLRQVVPDRGTPRHLSLKDCKARVQ